MEGDSFCMANGLEMEDSHKEDVPQTIHILHALRGGFSVLSFQLLEDKQHLGGEDCNVPKFSCRKLEH